MNYKALIKDLHYPDNLYGIVEKYAAVGDKRLGKLLNFIEEVSDDELDDMAADLKNALRKRIKNNSVNERIYEDDLGLYYDRHAHGYKFKESWMMGGRKKRRKRGGTVGYGERCGTNEDCDDGLKCDLERLLSGPQVDNNQRGTCKGGRRRRRKRTRRKKKSKRRRRKKTRTKKKRRRRRRK